jgi:beta-xylosidase
MESDGLRITDEPWVELIRNTLSWEADLVEGPWFLNKDGYYYLFYSGHCYCDSTYSVGVARSKNPLGPYEKKGDPIRTSDSLWIGPGHCSVVPSPNGNEYVMVYHSW